MRRPIAQLPAGAWPRDTLDQAAAHIAELTGLNARPGWPEGTRLLVRRERPSRRDEKKLTAFEKHIRWRYQITATNNRHMRCIAGSHQAQWLDALARAHAVVEDQVKANKAM
ncbi:hypothetical protein [Kitasatospora cheerisanensis]|uniref:Uncharacterized protein n=1 Tax=Kitasatospora cheerisanensis KCTC 2395 TaxID=1348663 RepID=A0A066YVK1_9ACTN|nr:hypothetical protein [Kitasatospora cheerisanensis]KDN85573.1 hypothetical protein KCH_28040 [Kitasatospora cheerisanensis KCTC 2395]